jgi:hypothetical protein
MTLLRNDLRSEEKNKQQSGWLDNIITRKSKDAPEIETATKPRPVREPQMPAYSTPEAPPEPRVKPQPVAAAVAVAPLAPAPAPIPTRVERPMPLPSKLAEPSLDPEPDQKPQVPVGAVVYGAVFAIVALVASLQGKDGLLGVLIVLTVGLLGTALLGSVNREGRKKAFWQGFAVFGFGYLFMALVPAFPNEIAVELPTSRLIKVVYAKSTGTPEDTRSAFAIMKSVPTVEALPLAPEPGMPATQTASLFTPGDLRQFTVVGHCCFTLLLAFLGSAISRLFYRTNLAV